MNDDLVISFFDCCQSEEKVLTYEGVCAFTGEVFHFSPVGCPSGACFSLAVSAFEGALRLAEKGWKEISAVCIRVGSAVGKLKRKAVRTFQFPVKRSALTGRRFLAHAGILRI